MPTSLETGPECQYRCPAYTCGVTSGDLDRKDPASSVSLSLEVLTIEQFCSLDRDDLEHALQPAKVSAVAGVQR